jgi:predicted metal-dependent peptidase
MMSRAIELKLAKAKTNLILQHPFVGSVAMNMPFELSDEVPTAATNGKKVVFNPDFVDTLTDEEVTFLVAHECMHPMLEHNYRRLERDPQRWNAAADYVINKLLTDEKIGRMPEIGLLDDDIYNDGGGTSDGIYNILPESPEGGDGGGNPYGPALDECQDAEGTPQEQSQQAAEWRVKVAQAAQAAKMCGKLSANMERLVDEVLSPKVDWRDVLQQFVEKCRDDLRSWARPNRRLISQGIFLPSADGEAMPEMVVAVDCSGSITAEIINQFAAEVKTIHEDQKPKVIHVIYFDHTVSHVDEFTRDDEVEIKMHGGGGTAFSPIFAKVEELDIHPVACVVLTDLYCDDFGDQPEYPVLWVTNGRTEAPWGEVVEM